MNGTGDEGGFLSVFDHALASESTSQRWHSGETDLPEVGSRTMTPIAAVTLHLRSDLTGASCDECIPSSRAVITSHDRHACLIECRENRFTTLFLH